MTNSDIIAMIQENKPLEFEYLNFPKDGKERTIQNILIRINMGLIKAREVKNCVKIEKRGMKKVIKITDKGTYASCLLGR